MQSITLPVNYLIMMSLFVLAGSHAPTAVAGESRICGVLARGTRPRRILKNHSVTVGVLERHPGSIPIWVKGLDRDESGIAHSLNRRAPISGIWIIEYKQVVPCWCSPCQMPMLFRKL